MPAKQRMRVQSEKHSKNVNIRGNVPKSEVRSLCKFSSESESVCINFIEREQ